MSAAAPCLCKHSWPAYRGAANNLFGGLVATATLPVRNVLPGVVRKIETSVGNGFLAGAVHGAPRKVRRRKPGTQRTKHRMGRSLAHPRMEVASDAWNRSLGDLSE